MVLLCLAALCLPAFANVPRASLLNEKPRLGGESFALASHRVLAAANTLIAPGIAGCLCDEGRRSRSTGKERDGQTGLDYFLARYYSAPVGRFTSLDPAKPSILHQLNPQRWNMYSYALNNPHLYVDPDGRDAIMVRFSKAAFGLGHAGIASVNRDGTGIYGDFQPQKAGSFVGKGSYEIRRYSTRIVYGVDGKPTKESLSALANEFAELKKQPKDSVSVAYFKTTEAETQELESYLLSKYTLNRYGNSGYYVVGFNDCIHFTMFGLHKAGVASIPTTELYTIPNYAFWYYSWWADQTANGRSDAVTSQLCFTDTNGKKQCQ